MAGQLTLRGSSKYPNPFDDIASKSMPRSVSTVFDLCEYVYDRDGTYGRAIERVVSYFLTDLVFDEVSADERTKWIRFSEERLALLSKLKEILENRQCYGNAFISTIVKFQRFLICAHCREFQATLREVYSGGYEFDFRDYSFIARCPLCYRRDKMIVDDKEGSLDRDIILKLWNPKEMHLTHDIYTGENAYWWRIPERYKRQVQSGKLHFLARVPKSVLEAMRTSQDYLFNDDQILHLKDPTLAGRYNAGWGFPSLFRSYRTLFYVQMLRRYNEALMLDYVVPTRILTPALHRGASGRGGGLQGSTPDPLSGANGQMASAFLRRIVSQKNRYPDRIHTVPFPVQYQLLGGDANKLAPHEMLDQGVEQLLNENGVAVSFYKGTLELQQAPTALRLMESTHRHLVRDADRVIRHVVSVAAQTLQWTEPLARLKSITLADDLDKKNMALQLMLNDRVSSQTALDTIGLDADQERNQIISEKQEDARAEAQAQREMEADGMAIQLRQEDDQGQGQGQGQGGAPAGGAPAGGGEEGAQVTMPVTQFMQQMGPNPNISIEELESIAMSLAQELLSGQVPETIKDSELRKLKQYNQPLHSMVGTAMEELRRQARAQGGAMLLGS